MDVALVCWALSIGGLLLAGLLANYIRRASKKLVGEPGDMR